jgi:hypothetical protein
VEVPTGDFQDLGLWRRQVAGLAVGLVEEYHRPVLIPMTLVNSTYAGEIFSALKNEGIDVHHFFLEVPREVPEKRIDGRSFTPDAPEQDERIRRWCKDRIGACMAGADTLPSDTVVLDGELSPQELADQVLVRVRAGGPSGAYRHGGLVSLSSGCARPRGMTTAGRLPARSRSAAFSARSGDPDCPARRTPWCPGRRR